MSVEKSGRKQSQSTYLKRSWMLYLMLALPIAFFLLFRYVPMTNIVIAFKNYNIFQGVWASGEPYCDELTLTTAAPVSERTGTTAAAADMMSLFESGSLFEETEPAQSVTADSGADTALQPDAVLPPDAIEDSFAAPAITARVQFGEGHSAACGRSVCCREYGHKQGCSHWVGFAWFKTAFESRAFWNAVRNTIVLNLLDLLLGFPAPIILALLLNELIFKSFKKVTQTIIYLPHFLSWIIVSSIATRLLAPSTGVLNIFLVENFGIGPIDFLMDKGKWIMTYILFGVWKDMGWGTIIYLAAITGINPELYEAAEVDGAGRLRKLWNVTLPGIRPTIIILLIMNMGRILGIELDRPFTMANNIVREVADVISTFVYRVGIQSFQFSLTAAVGLFQSVICVIFLVGANAMAKKFGERGIW